MTKYYISIAILTILCLGIIFAGFILAGFPTSQRDVTLDSYREQDFLSLSTSIQTYFNNNKELPINLTVVPNTESIKDPKTQKKYDYKKITATSYKLCTTFSTEIKPSVITQEDYSYMSEFNHKKGYNCVTYTVNTSSYNNYGVIPPSHTFTTLPSVTPTTKPGELPSLDNKGILQDKVIVLHPNNTDTVCIGKPYTISWEAQQRVQGLSLYLYTPENQNGNALTIYSEIVNANSEKTTDISKGSYVWNVPSTIDGKTLTPAYGYKIGTVTSDSGTTARTYYTSDLFTLSDCK